MKNEIGGHLKFELDTKKLFHQNTINLNSGRFCLKYFIKAIGLKKIFMPHYTCQSLKDAVSKENIEIIYYHIDENFMPEIDFQKDDFILYTNYFGICSKQVQLLLKKYKNLIIDNAQSFYMPLNLGRASFNSPRKFFPTADGGFLFCKERLDEKLEKDISYKRSLYLLKNYELGVRASYENFCLAEKNLDLENNIKKMSDLTSMILSSLDYKKARKIRLSNFKIYEKELRNLNLLKFKLGKYDVPMFYPFLVKKNLSEILIENNILTSPIWQEITGNEFENRLKTLLLPLPLNQNTTYEEILKVCEIIKNNI